MSLAISNTKKPVFFTVRWGRYALPVVAEMTVGVFLSACSGADQTDFDFTEDGSSLENAIELSTIDNFSSPAQLARLDGKYVVLGTVDSIRATTYSGGTIPPSCLFRLWISNIAKNAGTDSLDPAFERQCKTYFSSSDQCQMEVDVFAKRVGAAIPLAIPSSFNCAMRSQEYRNDAESFAGQGQRLIGRLTLESSNLSSAGYDFGETNVIKIDIPPSMISRLGINTSTPTVISIGRSTASMDVSSAVVTDVSPQKDVAHLRPTAKISGNLTNHVFSQVAQIVPAGIGDEIIKLLEQLLLANSETTATLLAHADQAAALAPKAAEITKATEKVTALAARNGELMVETERLLAGRQALAAKVGQQGVDQAQLLEKISEINRELAVIEGQKNALVGELDSIARSLERLGLSVPAGKTETAFAIQQINEGLAALPGASEAPDVARALELIQEQQQALKRTLDAVQVAKNADEGPHWGQRLAWTAAAVGALAATLTVIGVKDMLDEAWACAIGNQAHRYGAGFGECFSNLMGNSFSKMQADSNAVISSEKV